MFKVLDKNITNSFTIKKSKFLTFGYYVTNKEEIKDIIDGLKKQYPDASHICYGYILDNNTYYFTDGGEPSGTAGQPIYNAIKNSDINYCLFVVIRYFGGIKFGPGPLKKTFRDVTLDTLNKAKLVEASLKDVIEVEASLSNSKQTIKNLSIYIIHKKYTSENVKLTLAGSKEELVELIMNLKLTVKSIKEKQIVKNKSPI